MSGQAPPSLPKAAFLGLCPRCGEGKLFSGLLSLKPRCDVCGLEFGKTDTGDATAVPMLLVLGSIIVGLAFWVEFRFSPPLWVHAVMWPIVTVPLAILMMRPLKAGFVALQFRTRPDQMGL